MKKIYIGIDPGQDGGIAVIDEEYKYAIADVYSNEALIETLETIPANKAVCCLEKVHSMPGQGVKSMFSFGQNFGFINHRKGKGHKSRGIRSKGLRKRRPEPACRR